MINEEWLNNRLAEASSRPVVDNDSAVHQLRVLLERSAERFAAGRPDVESAQVTWPKRGLRSDEATSLFRAVDAGLASVDDAGFITMHCVRQKTPPGRYALLSKNGGGVSVNLEYVIQIGATAELILDHGWPPEKIDFECGQLDARAYGDDGRVLLACEAKARVTGDDGLEKLVRDWITFSRGPIADVPRNNAGRKYLELHRLCEAGPVTVWLVADDARWTMVAEWAKSGVRLHEGGDVSYGEGAAAMAKREVILTQPHDKSLHGRGTKGSEGKCSWLCEEPAVYSTRVREVGGSESTFALCELHQQRVETVYSS